MDMTTMQFVFWTVGTFVAGIAAGIGGVALWVFRALRVHDATEGNY
jgi:hypothetical protein